MHFRRTKIVATLGPACDGQLEKLLEAGVNVARMNFSHGDHAEHSERWGKLQAAVKLTGKTIAIMLDTQGPKVRTGTFTNGSMDLIEGEQVKLLPGREEGGIGSDGQKSIYINYAKLLSLLQIHKVVYFSDGLLEVKVERVEKRHAVARVVTGGKIGNYKGVNVPHAEWDLPTIGSKDEKDIQWGVDHNVDYVAQSFVRNASDVRQLRKLLDEKGAKDTKIIAKIEEYPAVQNIDEIIEVADGIMVARGDLGVQMHVEQVPGVQKMIIKKCNHASKPVITATQMLESMTNSPFPTRAEVTDVANAILDGSDAVMLSGETSAGKYPLKTVQMMAKVIDQTEQHVLLYDQFDKFEHGHIEDTKQANSAVMQGGKAAKPNVTLVIGKAACRIASEVNAKVIVAYTETGQTPRYINRIRPKMPIIAVTESEKVARQLCLSWGLLPIVFKGKHELGDRISEVAKIAIDKKFAQKGDFVIMVSGLPFGQSGHTNLIKVKQV